MQVSKLIHAPIEVVWEVLIDTRQWPIWGPSVKAVSCSQRYITAGLQGQLKTVVGLWTNFEITDFEPQRYWHWKVAGIPATGHRLEKRGESSCELIFEMPFVALPYALICRQAANRIAKLAEQAADRPQERTEP